MTKKPRAAVNINLTASHCQSYKYNLLKYYNIEHYNNTCTVTRHTIE